MCQYLSESRESNNFVFRKSQHRTNRPRFNQSSGHVGRKRTTVTETRWRGAHAWKSETEERGRNKQSQPQPQWQWLWLWLYPRLPASHPDACKNLTALHLHFNVAAYFVTISDREQVRAAGAFLNEHEDTLAGRSSISSNDDVAGFPL